MKLTIVLERHGDDNPTLGWISARVKQGPYWGDNLLAGRMITLVDSAKQAAADALHYHHPSTQIQIEFEDRTGTK